MANPELLARVARNKRGPYGGARPGIGKPRRKPLYPGVRWGERKNAGVGTAG